MKPSEYAPVAAPQRLVITVHGIRTFGRWQEKLERKLHTEIREGLEVCHYRYGFFTVFAFLLPPLRWLATKRFRSELLEQTNRKKWSRIDIVAHSFGTHLVAWGLLGISKPSRPKIHTVIFAGSVLKSSFPIRELVGESVARLVNDCGTKDHILLVNQLFVLFTGMAGRIGFIGMQSDFFQNRYFEFGHSEYFLKSSEHLDFIDEYWLPLLRSDSGIRPHDNRPTNRFRDVTALLLNNAEPIKLAAWTLPLLFALAYMNNLRLEAKRQAEVAISRQLILESELVGKQLVDPNPSAVLATEAIEMIGTADTSVDRTFREATNLLPRQTWVVELGGAIGAVAFSPDGRYVATGSTDKTVRLIEVAHGREVLRFAEQDWILGLLFSADGRYIVTESRDHTARVFEVTSGREVSRLIHDDSVLAAAFSPDGQHITTWSADETIRVFDAGSGRELSRLRKSRCSIDAVAFGSNGRLLAIGCNNHAAVLEEPSGRGRAVD